MSPDGRETTREDKAAAAARRGWFHVGIRAGLVFVLGSAAHFAFDWLGRPSWVATVFPVNESVFEHCKMAFFPALLLRLLAEESWWRRFVAGGAGALAIVGLFYGYTAVLQHRLILDIAVFALAVLFGEWLAERVAPRRGGVGGGLALAIVIAFALATYAPPDLSLFRDSRSGLTGLEAAAS